MKEPSGKDARYDELDTITREIEALPHRHELLRFIEHRRLMNAAGGMKKELNDIDAMLAPAGFHAAATDAQPRPSTLKKSGILASLSVLCKHLSTIASIAMHWTDPARTVVKRLAEWLIRQLTDIVEEARQIIGFSSWSLSVGAGFPSGLGYSITFDFV